jgi:uncharacterized UPF0146 family protein
MKKNLLLSFLTFFILNSWSQDSLYTKVFYQPANDLEANAVLATNDGGLLLAGISYFNAGFICKLDSLGNYLWNKFLDFQSPLSNDVSFNQLIETSNNDYVAVGKAVNNNNLQYEGYILKLNDLGDTLWSKSLTIANNSYYEISAVTEMNDGGYAVAGNINYGENIFVAKLSSNGIVDWSHILDAAGDSAVYVNSIQATATNGLYVSGYNDSTTATKFGTLHHFTDAGDYEWTKKYANTKTYGLEMTNQGAAMLALDLNNYSIAVIKTDFNGENANETVFFGQDCQFPEKLKFEMQSDSSFIFMNPADFGSRIFKANKELNATVAYKRPFMIGAAVVETKNKRVFAVGNGPIYGVKLLLQKHIGIIKMNENLQNPTAFCLNDDNAANLVTSPIVANDIVFVSSTGLNTFSNPATISTQILESVLDCVSFLGSVDEQTLASLIKIYPNVSTGVFHVEQAEMNDIELTVFDALGQKVHQQEFHGFETDIDLSNQKAGIYFYQMKDAKNRTASGKLILMN